jgi:hypothetical protein
MAVRSLLVAQPVHEILPPEILICILYYLDVTSISRCSSVRLLPMSHSVQILSLLFLTDLRRFQRLDQGFSCSTISYRTPSQSIRRWSIQSSHQSRTAHQTERAYRILGRAQVEKAGSFCLPSHWLLALRAVRGHFRARKSYEPRSLRTPINRERCSCPTYSAFGPRISDERFLYGSKHGLTRVNRRSVSKIFS